MKIKYPGVSELIKKARIAKKITQQSLADKFKFKSSQFVSNWERGISVPSITMAKKMCEILKIDKNKYKDAYLADRNVDEMNSFNKKWLKK